MPYTLSHVAVVLPFSRQLARLHVLSAVVIGSMVPDFGYFMPFRPSRLATHSAMSLLTFSLPVGLLSYWIFQRLMKTPLVSLLPDQAYMRWRPFSAPAALVSVRQWLLAACGVLVGAVTHLAWDGFTHEGARGMRMMPELDDWKFELHGHHLIGARLLEDGSSLFGLLIAFGFIAYALRRGRPQTVTPRVLSAADRQTWVWAFVVATLVLSLGFDIFGHAIAVFGPFVMLRLDTAAIEFMRGLLLAAVSISLLLTWYLRRRTGEAASPQ